MHHLTLTQEELAWSALATCIARREKKHALGIFRLLAQTLSDADLVRHLHADILYALQTADQSECAPSESA